MFVLILLSIIVCFYDSSLAKKQYCSGRLDGQRFCTYTPGDPETRIVINSPHSGLLSPDFVRTRASGCYINNVCIFEHDCGVQNHELCLIDTTNDKYSGPIAKQIVKDIEKAFGVRPHFIFNNIGRDKMDANRDIRTSTFGDPDMMKTFHEYHNFIRKAIDSVKGPVLFIDIHGHHNPFESIEVGYRLLAQDLNEGHLNPTFSSIRGLAKRSKYSFKNIISGNVSLGNFIQNGGYKVVPSPDHPGPGKEEYYRGGTNMHVHSSLWNERVDGIQIEVPLAWRNPKQIPAISDALSKALIQWISLHYDLEPKDENPPI